MLSDSSHERKQSVLTTLLSEMPAYLLLLKELNDEDGVASSASNRDAKLMND